MKAMILAAGMGTRLRPLTYKIPKPLLPAGGKPLIRHALDILKTAGIREVMVNLHHLPQPLKAYLRMQKDFKISFSYEKEILGTGGGIQKVKKFFRNQTFMVINSDMILFPNLRQFIAFHKKKKALASLLVRIPKPKERYACLGINSHGKITSFETKKIHPPLKKVMFTGLHILEPKIFDYFPAKKKFCIINDVYKKLASRHEKLYAKSYRGTWIDLGTLGQYLTYNLKVLKGKKKDHFKQSLKKLVPGVIFPKTT